MQSSVTWSRVTRMNIIVVVNIVMYKRQVKKYQLGIFSTYSTGYSLESIASYLLETCKDVKASNGHRVTLSIF
ncbi:hypothetical protein L6164_005645 [Bauhinia variegata]|uniref:Uncharacterized protein n=1 Tax=Bauhinia variegata TaxID=167791 RepID=A0ACB9PR02_BAUVA|nr:hypothetical protein L6164_005645 [Bauhinia variegata]